MPQWTKRRGKKKKRVYGLLSQEEREFFLGDERCKGPSPREGGKKKFEDTRKGGIWGVFP